jgi:hypothetical protein
MIPAIEQNRAKLESLCRRFHVRRLDLFGSAAINQMHPASDLDFLVEFDDTVASNRFDTYFELLESLKRLFGCPVDLVEPGGLRNPYFIQRVNETRRPVYAAS